MSLDTLSLLLTDPISHTIINLSPQNYEIERFDTETYSARRPTNTVEFSYAYYCGEDWGVDSGYTTSGKLRELAAIVHSFVKHETDSLTFTASGDEPYESEFFTVKAAREPDHIIFSFGIYESLIRETFWVKNLILTEDEFTAYANIMISWSESFPILSDEDIDAMEERSYFHTVTKNEIYPSVFDDIDFPEEDDDYDDDYVELDDPEYP